MVADFIKAIIFHFLTAENQYFFMPFQHLFSTGADLSHAALHVFTDFTEADRDFTDNKSHNRRNNDQNQRQLPAVVKHQPEQRNNISAFTDDRNQCAGRRRSHLFGIIGDTGEQCPGGLLIKEGNRHAHHMPEQVTAHGHNHFAGHPGEAVA